MYLCEYYIIAHSHCVVVHKYIAPFCSLYRLIHAKSSISILLRLQISIDNSSFARDMLASQRLLLHVKLQERCSRRRTGATKLKSFRITQILWSSDLISTFSHLSMNTHMRMSRCRSMSAYMRRNADKNLTSMHLCICLQICVYVYTRTHI